MRLALFLIISFGVSKRLTDTRSSAIRILHNCLLREARSKSLLPPKQNMHCVRMHFTNRMICSYYHFFVVVAKCILCASKKVLVAHKAATFSLHWHSGQDEALLRTQQASTLMLQA